MTLIIGDSYLGERVYCSLLSDNNFFAAIGPAKESAVAIIRQCLTIFDPQRDFAEESKALSAQLIAELAKTDVGRSLCLHQVVSDMAHIRHQ